jgi:hypothetical protein
LVSQILPWIALLEDIQLKPFARTGALPTASHKILVKGIRIKWNDYPGVCEYAWGDKPRRNPVPDRLSAAWSEIWSQMEAYLRAESVADGFVEVFHPISDEAMNVRYELY